MGEAPPTRAHLRGLFARPERAPNPLEVGQRDPRITLLKGGPRARQGPAQGEELRPELGVWPILPRQGEQAFQELMREDGHPSMLLIDMPMNKRLDEPEVKELRKAQRGDAPHMVEKAKVGGKEPLIILNGDGAFLPAGLPA